MYATYTSSAGEKRTTLRRWARTDKQIEKLIFAMAGLYGDIQGLIGSSLPAIPLLSSADGPDDPSEAADEDGQELIGPADPKPSY